MVRIGHPWSTVIFGVALGYFEAAVVVYLKRLELLGELAVGQRPLDNELILVEVIREVASLILLAAVAWGMGRTRGERLGHFALAFGLWDIFYYVFLRLTIGWPERLLDWDILFLIPAPWYGPVLTPILVSLLLIFGGWGVVVGERFGVRLRMTRVPFSILVVGCSLILASFLWNAQVRVPFPDTFPWWLFWTGWVPAAAVTVLVLLRISRDGSNGSGWGSPLSNLWWRG